VLLNLLGQTAHLTNLKFFAVYNDSSFLQDAFSRLVEKSFASPLDTPSRMRNALIKLSPIAYTTIKKLYYRWVSHRVRPDLVYINTVNDTPHARQALAMGVPVVVHAHEMDFLVTFRIREEWIQQLVSRASLWIVCSNAVGEFYITTYGLPPERVRVLHGPVSSARIVPTRQGHYRHLMGCPAHCLVVGVSASFTYLKGADLFIRAISLVKQSFGQPVRFAWLGLDPSARNTAFYVSMNKLVSQYGLASDFHIFPSTTAVGDFYTDVDLLVAPSRIEAMGLSILEAMLHSKPVVALDVGGMGEAVDETTGILVKDRSPEGLAAGILSLLKNDERRREAGQRARERAYNHFEAEAQAPKWASILENITTSN
jgi:glycosyltransferase involved in cell wall biosynthesis